MAEQAQAGPNKVIIALAAIAAGAATQRAVSVLWRTVRGPEPSDDDSPLGEALVFAAVSAATVAAAKTWATQRARRRALSKQQT